MQFFADFWKTCKRQLSARTFRQGMFSLALIALVLAIVIALNMLFSVLPTIYTSFDLTEKQQIEELSNTTKSYISSLTRDITVYFLAVPGTEDARISRVLERYAALSSHLHIEQVNPELHPDFANVHGITEELEEGSMIVESALRNKAISYSDYYIEVFSLPVTQGIYLCDGADAFADFREALRQQLKLGNTEADNARLETALTAMAQTITYGEYMRNAGKPIPEVVINLEAELTTAIDFVNLESLSVIYQVEGHGETALTDAVANLLTGENVSLKKLSLTEGVPADCTSLLISAPTSDYTEAELTALKKYLTEGGHLILLSGNVTKAPSLYALLSEEYGVTLLEGTVYDPERHLQDALLVKPNQKAHTGIDPLLGGSYTVLLYRAGALTYTQRTGVTVKPLLTSSSAAWLRTSNATSMSKQEGDVEGTYTYAVTVEKPVTEKKTTQIVWFGTASIVNAGTGLSTNFNNLSGGGNYRYLLAAALWNVEQHGSLTMDTAAMTYISVLAVPQRTATVWLIVLAVLIPLTVLTVGVIRTTKRRVR